MTLLRKIFLCFTGMAAAAFLMAGCSFLTPVMGSSVSLTLDRDDIKALARYPLTNSEKYDFNGWSFTVSLREEGREPAFPDDKSAGGWSSSKSAAFTPGKKSISLVFNNVPVGITITGYASIYDEDGVEVYWAFVEPVTVKEGKNDIFIEMSGNYKFLYVASDGTDEKGRGLSEDNPCASISWAVQTYINKTEISSDEVLKTFRIYVSGMISGRQVIEVTSDLPCASRIILQGKNYSPSSKEIMDGIDGNMGKAPASDEGSALVINSESVPVEIKGLKITGGNSIGDYGGGIHIEGGTVSLKDGVLVAGNRAVNGGGIYNKGSLYIYGGTIEENSADYGGGIYYTGSEIKIEGGCIRENYAEMGGAFYIAVGESDGKLNMGGSFEIPAGEEKTNDIYLCDGCLINITDDLDLSFEALITPESYEAEVQLITAEEWVNFEAELQCFTVKSQFDDEGMEIKWYLNEKGCLSGEEFIPTGPDFYVSSEGTEGGDGSIDNPFASIEAACALMNSTSTDYVIYVSGEITGPQKIGEESPDNDIQAKSITINGKENAVLKGNQDGSSLTVYTGVPVIIKNITITGGSGSEAQHGNGITTSWTSIDGGGLYIRGYYEEGYQADVTIGEGTVINKNTAQNGAGVYQNCGTLRMTGGKISENTAGTDSSQGAGGGLYVRSGSFYMTGGVICGNTASDCNDGYSGDKGGLGGGVYLYDSTVMYMSGYAVIGDMDKKEAASASSASNTAACGGGVFVSSKNTELYLGYNEYDEDSGEDIEVPLYGGIYYNYANYFANETVNSSGCGGGVYVEKYNSSGYHGTLIINSGTIAYNGSERDGGGVYLSSNANTDASAVCEMTGGVITGNECGSDYNGDGVYVAKSGSYSATFTNNGGTVDDQVYNPE